MSEPETRTCGARKRNGEPCRERAMRGQERCWRHGGKSPQALRAAERRDVEAKARKRLAGMDVEPVDDPVQALLDVVAEARTFKDVLARDLGDGDAARADAYGRALERVGKLLVDVNRLGLEDRLVRLKELQVRTVVDAMHGVFRDLGLDPRDPEVRAAVRRRFTGLGDGADEQPGTSATRSRDARVVDRVREELGRGGATWVTVADAVDAVERALAAQ